MFYNVLQCNIYHFSQDEFCYLYTSRTTARLKPPLQTLDLASMNLTPLYDMDNMMIGIFARVSADFCNMQMQQHY